MTPPRFVLRLGKEDFKFSVAHFTVFSDQIAEDLHGHNYRVRVEIAGQGTDELGLLLDLRDIKAEIRRLCAELDSKTLVPEHSQLVECRRRRRRLRGSLRSAPLSTAHRRREDVADPQHVDRGARRLVLADAAADALGSAIEELRVEVEETAGQSCIYSASVERRADVTIALDRPYDGSHAPVDRTALILPLARR